MSENDKIGNSNPITWRDFWLMVGAGVCAALAFKVHPIWGLGFFVFLGPFLWISKDEEDAHK